MEIDDRRQVTPPVLARREMRRIDRPALVGTSGPRDPALDARAVSLRPLPDLPTVAPSECGWDARFRARGLRAEPQHHQFHATGVGVDDDPGFDRVRVR